MGPGEGSGGPPGPAKPERPPGLPRIRAQWVPSRASAPTSCARWSCGYRDAPACPPGGDQPPQRLPGARRRHRHEHGPHRWRRCARRSTAPTATSRRCARPISHGSLMGARGNSGVILSQVLRGMSGVVRRRRRASTAPARPPPSTRRPTAAYEAVMRAGRGHDPHRRPRGRRRRRRAGQPTAATLVEVLDAAPAQGADALARTPEMLPVLAEAGVVDAGGTGLPAAARRAAPRGRRPPGARAGRGRGPGAPDVLHGPRRRRRHGDISDLRYEVMYLLEAPDESIPRLQGRVGRHRRLDRRGRRRRPLELPHPHRRHRRVDRGRHRHRPAPQDPRDRPPRAGRGGALGPRGRRRRRARRGARAPAARR